MPRRLRPCNALYDEDMSDGGADEGEYIEPLSPDGHGVILFDESDSHVNVNWVFCGVELEPCCCSKLTFSFPFCGVTGCSAAFAIAADMMP